MNKEIQADPYSCQYDPETATFRWDGVVRLGQIEDYEPIGKLLEDALNKDPSRLTLDLTKLNFLNSSGINFLAQFTLKVRERKDFQLVVKASKDIPWQGKSLKNLKKIMDSVQLEWE